VLARRSKSEYALFRESTDAVAPQCVSVPQKDGLLRNTHASMKGVDIMSASPMLSICISTFNRGAFIGETLESIISQISTDCEIVVSDNASQDDTEEVVSKYVQCCDRLRYIRQTDNSGVDRNYDRTVEVARGEYCWLLGDDDPIKPGGVAAVLQALEQDFSLVLVNAEIRDVTLSTVVKQKMFDSNIDRVYGPNETDRLLSELAPYRNFIAFISSYVIKRTIWRERERERYYGSWFIHVGVAFQKSLPGKTLVISEPLITCRLGGEYTYWSQWFELGVVHWPAVVGSLAISDGVKKSIGRDHWKNPLSLLLCRGLGGYSMLEYRRYVRPRLRSLRERLIPFLVATLPRTISNVTCMMYLSFDRRPISAPYAYLMRRSRFHICNWRIRRGVSSGPKRWLSSGR
jgi:glycosyltransferase involved in cell wall biosynthesis